MTDPINAQPISNIPSIEEESSVAGGAAVTPSYIPTEVQGPMEVTEATGIDNVAVSTGVSTQPAVSTEVAEKEEEANYIKSEVPLPDVFTQVLTGDPDALDMNSSAEITNAYRYIDPNDPALQALLTTMQDLGVITDSMTQDQMVQAIHDYVTSNFSYIAEAAGDHWYSPSETISHGGGDCEDLVNLEASLLTAAFMDRGLSQEEASQRVGAAVVGVINTGTGHVLVTYVDESGVTKYFDPTLKNSTGYPQISSTQFVLFNYNSMSVNVLNTGYDYVNLITATITIPTMPTINIDYTTILYQEQRLDQIQFGNFELMKATSVLSAGAYLDACQSTEDTAQWRYNNAASAYGGEEHVYCNCSISSQMFGEYHHYSFIDNGSGGINCTVHLWTVSQEGRNIITEYHAAIANLNTCKADWKSAFDAYVDAIVKAGWMTSAEGAAKKAFADNGDWYRETAEQELDALVNAHQIFVSVTPPGTNTPVMLCPTVSQLTGSLLEPYQVTVNGHTLNYYRLSPTNLTWVPATNGSSYLLNILDALKKEINSIKGNLMVSALVYETLRGLRDLVNQEMRGAEEGGYKGLDIPKLFQQKIDRVNQATTQIITNVLRFMNATNATVYQNEVNRLNNQYDQNSEDIEESGDSVGDFFDSGYWNQDEEQLENEQARLEAQQRNAQEYANVVTNNEEAAEAYLADAGITAGYSGINNIVNGLDGIDRQTVDANDDDQYREINWTEAERLRNELVGAGQLIRVNLMAVQAFADQRNLVHQEMTGISGRTMRTDITDSMVEAEQNNILMWFDQAVDCASQRVSINNQIRQYQINIDRVKEQLKEQRHWYNRALNYVAKAFQTVLTVVCAVVCAVVGAIFGWGVGAIPGWAVGAAIGAILGQLVSGIFSAIRSVIVAYDNARIALDPKYNDVIKYTEQHRTAPTRPTSTGDITLDLAFMAQYNAEMEIAGMDANTYLHRNANGSYAYDGAAYSAATDRISKYMSALTVVNGMRANTAEMRNLVHMEMTGIGGRSPSNMTNYMIEAARGQMAAVADYARNNIQDVLTRRNMEYQRAQTIRQAVDALDTAGWSLLVSFIPIVGTTAANLIDMYTRRDFYRDRANQSFTTSSTYQYENETLNNLINSGLVDLGDGQYTIDYNAVSQARTNATRNFIANSVKSAIQKAMQSMRSLAHMEMTGVGSFVGGEAVDEVSSIRFEAMLKEIDLITEYLGEKARVSNERHKAQDMVNQLSDQITTAWIGGVISTILSACSFIPGIGAVAAAACALGGTIASVITSYISADIARDYAARNANINADEIMALLTARRLMKTSVNSNESRLDQLAEESVDEITEMIMQNISGGMVGVNRGMAARYKVALEKAHRRDKTIKALRDSLQEMRNVVHELQTGKSGLVSKSTQQALSMRLKEASAKIDDAFKLVEEMAERLNERTEARKELAKANAAVTSTLIKGAVSIIISIINLLKANATSNGKSSDAKNKLDGAEKDLQSAKNDLESAKDGTPEKAAAERNVAACEKRVVEARRIYDQRVKVEQAKADVEKAKADLKAAKEGASKANADSLERVKTAQEGVTAAQNNLSVQTKAMSGMLTQYESYGNMMTVAGLAADLALAVYQKDVAMGAENEAVNNTNKYLQDLKASSKTKDADKQVLGSVGEATDIEDFTALIQTQSGKDDMMSKQMEGSLNRRKIMSQYNQDLRDWVSEVGLAEAKMIKALQKDDTVINPTVINAKMEKGTKAVTDAAKKLEEAQKSGDPKAIAAAQTQLNTATTQLTQITSDARRANLDSMRSYVEQLEAKVRTAETGATTGPSTAETEAPEAKMTLDDMRKELSRAKKELVLAQKQLGSAIEALRHAKDAVPEAQKAVVAAQEKLLEEAQRRLEDVSDLEEQIMKLGELAGGGSLDDAAKALVLEQKGRVEAALDRVLADYEAEGIALNAPEAFTTMKEDERAAADLAVQSAKAEVGEIRGRISSLIRAIAGEERAQARAVPAAGGTVNVAPNVVPGYNPGR